MDCEEAARIKCCPPECRNHRLKRAAWDKCLDELHDSSNACLKNVNLEKNNVIAPNPSQKSRKMRLSSLVRNNGRTVTGRWRSAIYQKSTKQYIILGNSRNQTCL